MDQVIRAVEDLRSISGAQIDCHYAQGHEALLAQLRLRSEGLSDVPDPDTEVEIGQQALAELQSLVAPYELPSDYQFFLEFYGGLQIDRPEYNFSVFGIGPMADEWYTYVLGDEGYYADGLLSIGSLVFRNGRPAPYVSFLLDVAGTIDRGCVIGMNYAGVRSTSYGSSIDAPRGDERQWTKLATSFTEWLELIVETQGTCGYR